VISVTESHSLNSWTGKTAAGFLRTGILSYLTLYKTNIIISSMSTYIYDVLSLCDVKNRRAIMITHIEHSQL
jgi:hypothetical protein